MTKKKEKTKREGSNNAKEETKPESQSRELTQVKEWEVGDDCRALHGGKEYEATVKKVFAKKKCAQIEFIGYGAPEESKLVDLKPSQGEKARLDQLFGAMSIYEYKGKVGLFPVPTIEVRNNLHMPQGQWKVGDRCRALRKEAIRSHLDAVRDTEKFLSEARIVDIVPRSTGNSSIYVKFTDQGDEEEAEHVLQDQIIPSRVSNNDSTLSSSTASTRKKTKGKEVAEESEKKPARSSLEQLDWTSLLQLSPKPFSHTSHCS